MNKNTFVVGYFVKNKTRFTCFDDGCKIQVQIARQSKEYSFQKLMKSIIGKLLTMSTSSNEVFYDYNVVSARWLDNINFEIYYDFRIKRLKGRKCHFIQFGSKDIDVFGQNHDFLNSVIELFKAEKSSLTKHELAINFEFLGNNYSLKIYNGLLAPIEMSHNISFSTFITIGSRNSIDTSTVLELFKLIKKTISFLVYRKNINFDFVDLYEKYESEETLNSLYGELYYSAKMTNHIFGNYSSNQMIKSNSVGSYLKQIIEAIANGTISCDYIPNETDSYNSIFINTTAWLQSFFREYAKKDSKYKVLKTGVRIGKKRVEFGTMIDTLKDYSKEYSEKTIASQLSYFSLFNDTHKFENDFTKQIVKIRNDLCHGSVNYEKYKYVKLYLTILQVILYASILKFIGVDKEKADKALEQLFL